MNRKQCRILFVIIFAGLILTALMLMRDSSRASDALVEESLKAAIENDQTIDLSEAAMEIQAAESSRARVIEESIHASLVESAAYEASVAASIAESASIEESVALSIAASIEAEEESIAEESRIAASIAASRASEEAAAASRAAAEALAAQEAAKEAQQQAANGGVTVLIGDSRTSGFAVWGYWPANLVFYMYNQVEQNYGKLNSAAACYPAKAVFSNGVDDLIANGVNGALGQYERYIATFQSLSPNTAIYVQSVLPCSAVGISKYPVLADIPTYNAYLQDMCNRNGWTYVDCSAGFSESVIGSDGIHFSSSWTASWLNNMRAIIGF